MIDWIAIRHFAITESVELELDDRFTAVTGETGSGKSLMVDALGILLGARADNSLIQFGKDQAEIQASFNLTADHPIFSWLRQHDLEDQTELQLRRIIRRDKPGRGYINGRPVNISMLRTLGESLVDIHGQHEHHSLMRRPIQQMLLDEAAGNQKVLHKVASLHDRVSALRKQLDELNNTQQSTAERMDLLKFQLGELTHLDPVQGEWEQLEITQKRQQHSKELISGTLEAAQILMERDNSNVHQELGRVGLQLRQLESLDSALGDIAAMLEEASVNVEEAARQLKTHYEATDLNAEEAEEVEQRISLYHSLSRKHRVHPNELAEYAIELQTQLDGLKNPEAETARLQKELDSAIGEYEKAAQQLTRKRISEAKKLGKKITAAMQDLGMEGGEFQVAIQPVPSSEYPRTGKETIEFRVTANPGIPIQPLAKIASGGEVSRISLAIQVILADAARVPTLVFDEVDVGIGGTVANVVGERLRQLGASRQVICVTHLAQVAARANNHFSVSKASDNGRSVKVQVRPLSDEQRIEEIARMSGSEKLTKQSRAHAEEMLATN
ncbi:MAG: DNA repair protein RecN [Acidiferrobacterales bacterium]|nr:DNA repair protein RecN [Acidiferrobacterales bacterium]